jgi:hypothetical protein
MIRAVIVMAASSWERANGAVERYANALYWSRSPLA